MKKTKSVAEQLRKEGHLKRAKAIVPLVLTGAVGVAGFSTSAVLFVVMDDAEVMKQGISALPEFKEIKSQRQEELLTKLQNEDLSHREFEKAMRHLESAEFTYETYKLIDPQAAEEYNEEIKNTNKWGITSTVLMGVTALSLIALSFNLGNIERLLDEGRRNIAAAEMC